MKLKQYIFNVLIGLDQWVTTWIGGYPDETLSSYAYRLNVQGKPWGFMRAVIDWIFFVTIKQEEHCLEAYVSEQEGRQQSPVFRNKAKGETQ